MPASQAGRRGFEPRLPLQESKEFTVCDAVRRYDTLRKFNLAEPVGVVLMTPPRPTKNLADYGHGKPIATSLEKSHCKCSPSFFIDFLSTSGLTWR